MPPRHFWPPKKMVGPFPSCPGRLPESVNRLRQSGPGRLTRRSQMQARVSHVDPGCPSCPCLVKELSHHLTCLLSSNERSCSEDAGIPIPAKCRPFPAARKIDEECSSPYLVRAPRWTDYCFRHHISYRHLAASDVHGPTARELPVDWSPAKHVFNDVLDAIWRPGSSRGSR